MQQAWLKMFALIMIALKFHLTKSYTTLDPHMCSPGICCVNYFMKDGLCIVCAGGTFGVNCSQVCPDGFYGRTCRDHCPTECEVTCHKSSGTCPDQVAEQTTAFDKQSYLPILIDTQTKMQEKVEWMNNLKYIPGLLVAQSIQSVVMIITLVFIVYMFTRLRRLHGILTLNCEQSKTLYTPATQGQGQLVLYTGLRHQATIDQSSSVEDQAYYSLPVSAEPHDQNS